MPTWGVTPAGFALKPLSFILADYQSAWLANVDPEANLAPTTPEGQILGILANADSELWELAQAAWNAYDREDVEGAGLDNLGDLQGAPREGESFTQVFCTLTISAGSAPYAPGSLIANVAGVPALTFSNLAAVTSAMISGGVATVLMQATTIGPTPTVNPGTLTQITSPVTGWTAITNPSYQSQLGANEETDSAYIVRQIQEIAGEGSSNASATAAALIALGAAQTPPITVTCEVLENTTDVPLVFGSLTLPPHSFAAIVYDPSATLTPAQIGAVVYANKPPGIASYGTTLATIADPVLGQVTVFYTAPTAVPLFINAVIVLRPGYTLAGVQAAIQAALVAAAVAPTPPSGAAPAGQLLPGSPVIGSQLAGVIMGVPGVFDLQALTFGTSASPTNTLPLPVSPTNIATVLATNIAVSTGIYP